MWAEAAVASTAANTNPAKPIPAFFNTVSSLNWCVGSHPIGYPFAIKDVGVWIPLRDEEATNEIADKEENPIGRTEEPG